MARYETYLNALRGALGDLTGQLTPVNDVSLKRQVYVAVVHSMDSLEEWRRRECLPWDAAGCMLDPARFAAMLSHVMAVKERVLHGGGTSGQGGHDVLAKVYIKLREAGVLDSSGPLHGKWKADRSIRNANVAEAAGFGGNPRSGGRGGGQGERRPRWQCPFLGGGCASTRSVHDCRH